MNNANKLGGLRRAAFAVGRRSPGNLRSWTRQTLCNELHCSQCIWWILAGPDHSSDHRFRCRNPRRLILRSARRSRWRDCGVHLAKVLRKKANEHRSRCQVHALECCLWSAYGGAARVSVSLSSKPCRWHCRRSPCNMYAAGEAEAMRRTPNWLQATPGYASLSIQAQWPGASIQNVRFHRA
jgi:hypothetical protein